MILGMMRVGRLLIWLVFGLFRPGFGCVGGGGGKEEGVLVERKGKGGGVGAVSTIRFWCIGSGVLDGGRMDDEWVAVLALTPYWILNVPSLFVCMYLKLILAA